LTLKPRDRRLLLFTAERTLFVQGRTITHQPITPLWYERLTDVQSVLGCGAIPLFLAGIIVAGFAARLNASVWVACAGAVTVSAAGAFALAHLLDALPFMKHMKDRLRSYDVNPSDRYLVDFNRMEGVCRLLGPLPSDMAEADFIRVEGPVIAAFPFERVKFSVSVHQTLWWSDCYDQPEEEDEDEDGDAISWLGLKVVRPPADDLGGYYCLSKDLDLPFTADVKAPTNRTALERKREILKFLGRPPAPVPPPSPPD